MARSATDGKGKLGDTILPGSFSKSVSKSESVGSLFLLISAKYDSSSSADAAVLAAADRRRRCCHCRCRPRRCVRRRLPMEVVVLRT